MEWPLHVPVIVWSVWVFLLGLGVGSFVNVLVARLPYEKSVVWPGSRCFTCLKPIRWYDNLPVLGYLLLRGRCRACGATFSARYLWVELLTGVLFVGLFLWEIVFDGHRVPAVRAWANDVTFGVPPAGAWVFFVYHATLLTLLLAASLIDAGHRIIPPAITYTGTVIGLVGGLFLAWPTPTDPAAVATLQTHETWTQPGDWGRIPIGARPWPVWGPLPDELPPGSWQLGLVEGLAGAAAGTFLVRAIKALFEVGLGKEALGMGDADLLMMAGAFLGWQPVVLSLFVGAFASLAIKLPMMVVERVRGVQSDRELPFGPGLAAGVVLTWLGWRWIGPAVQFVFFDGVLLGAVAVVMGGGMLAAGLLLRRGGEPGEEAAR